MFKNLQTWQIITIVLVVLLIIGAIAYIIRKAKKAKKDKKDEKVLPKLLATSASLRSTSNLASSVNQANLQKRDNVFFRKLGLALCGREITDGNELHQKLKEKFPNNNKSEILTFYIFYSTKLTEQQKKDLIVSSYFEEQMYHAIKNETFDNISYLMGIDLGDSNKSIVTCKGIDKELFCNGREEIILGEYSENLYNFLSTLFDINKNREQLRKMLIRQGKRDIKMNEDGSSTEEVKPYTEEELQIVLNREASAFNQTLQAVKTKFDSIPFCSLL